jgi:hypothetical protein
VSIPSNAAQHLRVLLGDFVGDSSSSMLANLCVNILQHGSSTSSPQQQEDCHQQQQQALLHLWSLTASLLKLPIRSVTGVQLITGCTTVAAVGLEAMQLIMQHAADDVSTGQQRLVLAPWWVLTGRCLLAQARLLRKLLDDPPPVDLMPRLACLDTLRMCLLRLRSVIDDWTAGPNSSSSGGSRSGTSAAPAFSFTDYLGGLQQQLQQHGGCAAGSRGAAATLSAVAAAASRALDLRGGYLDLFGQVEFPNITDGQVSESLRTTQAYLTWFALVLQAAGKHMAGLDSSGAAPSSSSSRQGDSSPHQPSPQPFLSLEEKLAAVKQTTTRDECWRYLATLPNMQLCLQVLNTIGLLLCNQLPMPWLCNNPHCTNLSGVSELQLVGGKACVCGGCRVAR